MHKPGSMFASHGMPEVSTTVMVSGCRVLGPNPASRCSSNKMTIRHVFGLVWANPPMPCDSGSWDTLSLASLQLPESTLQPGFVLCSALVLATPGQPYLWQSSPKPSRGCSTPVDDSPWVRNSSTGLC